MTKETKVRPESTSDYGYFRHIFNFCQDPKIQELKRKGGMEAMGFYLVLLELYEQEWFYDCVKKKIQSLDLEHLVFTTQLQSISIQEYLRLLSECELINNLSYSSDMKSVQFGVPSSIKYFRGRAC